MTDRILHIIPTLDQGGAEKQLTLLAAGLPADEFEVHVATLTRGGPRRAALDAAQIPVQDIHKSRKLDFAAYRRLKAHIRRLAPRLVHTWLFAANSYGRQAAFACGVPHVVAGERSVDPWKSWYQLAIDRRLARRSDCIVTNSRGVRDFYVGHGLPAGKFTIIPNGIADNPVEVMDRAQWLHECNLPPDARVIGAIGRLWPQKRYKDLIFAAELVRQVRDDAHLVIVGDGPLRDRLLAFRDDLRLQGRVHFLGERQDVSRWLPHVDCFWLGSAYEGQSNALMEAMLAGVPVVVSDIPGNRDLVEDQVSGYLVTLGDRAAFASRTNQLLDDRELAGTIGSQARQRMRNEFSVERMVGRHVDLYRGLLQA